ncbi:predicted protein [Nematostella vectensis]|uniref:Major facilitator superfamily (MFS) profile domain-containing protein n=1 Tax=Nematostella vectensis TaxID=45351 RepID=A7RP85_NEMVE|nr:predicted protein [Nematostella vectensis]|eukprot:XP_001638755.1 predicted protein [Nematostella vectensis]
MIPCSYKRIEDESLPDNKGVKSREKLFLTLQDIDRGFIISKLFYFLFYSSLGALFPFLSLYYKQLWLSPIQIGILLALRPSVKLVCLPLWKMVTDKFSKYKFVYFISMFGWIIGYLGQTFVCPVQLPCYVENPLTTQVAIPTTYLAPFNQSGKLLNLSTRNVTSINSWNGNDMKLIKRDRSDRYTVLPYEKFSTTDGELSAKDNEFLSRSLAKGPGPASLIVHRKLIKESEMSKKPTVGHQKEAGYHKASEREFLGEKRLLFERKKGAEKQLLQKRNENYATIEPLVLKSSSTHFSKSKSTLTKSKSKTSPHPSHDFRVHYNSLIFLTLLVIVFLTEVLTTPTLMLADSEVVQALANTESRYGDQRLLGSFGLALAALLAALWTTLWSECHYTDTINYLPCFYLFEIALAATIIISLFFKLDSPDIEGNEVNIFDGLKFFKTPRAGFFLLTIFLLGFAHSIQISFLFWFLQDLGGTPILFAVIIIVYSFAEVVMYFSSSFVVQKIGHQGTLSLALACYTARFLMYANLTDPWLVIPIELVQGLTYGGVWSIAPTYISVPEEASSMIQNILQGAYWGVGMAAGSLISGVVIQAYGVQTEFSVVAVIAFALFTVHVSLVISDRVKAIDEELAQRKQEGLDNLLAVLFKLRVNFCRLL